MKGPDGPTLVVVFHPHSVPPMEIAEAARGWCRLLWVFDCGDPQLAPLLPLMRRLGDVVDTAGCSDDEVAARVGQRHPDGVITFSELIPLAAAIAAESGLRYHQPHTAELVTNKYLQRVALAAAGVPGPRFWAVPAPMDPGERARLAEELPLPVVLKPQSGSGSQNTHRVCDLQTLLDLLEEGRSAGEDLVIEEELAESRPRAAQRFGETLMVDSVVRGGRAAHYAVTGHFIPAEPFRGTGSFIPSHLDDGERAAVLEATEAALAALGVENGFTNTDIILTPDGPRVLEVNGRIGGQIPKLLGMGGAPPLLPEAMRFSLGQSEGAVPPAPDEHVAFCAMYQAPVGAQRLVELDGVDAVAQMPDITGVVPDRRVGDVIDWRRGTLSRLLTVYGLARDHDHLYDLYREIHTSIVARYDMAEETVRAGTALA